MAQVTAQDVEKLVMEIPEGYEPQPFTPVQVRGILDIRADFESDHEDWLNDMWDNLTEQYLPAEEQYQQEENLRMIQYRIEHAGDDENLKELLQAESDRLLDKYVDQRVTAENQRDAAFAAELKRHYIAELDILNGDYEPVNEELLESSISEEELLKGYVPEPYEGSGVDRSVEEQRELFEEPEEDSDKMIPVDEEKWTEDMRKIIREEVMPAKLLYGQEELLRKLQYQIDRLNEDKNVRNMKEPYEIIEPDREILGDELYEMAVRDQLYKSDLNRRINRRNGLQQELDNLLDMISEERAEWEKEVDRRMDEEIALREEKLEDRANWLREQQEEKEAAEAKAREDEERRKLLEKEAKLFAKEAKKWEAVEQERAEEERKRQAEKDEQERQRRIEARRKELEEEQAARDAVYFADYVKRLERQRREEQNEADYQAWLAERRNGKKSALKEQITGEVEPEENTVSKAGVRPEGDATGTGLGEFLQDDQPQQGVASGDIDLGNQGSAEGFFDEKPGDIDLGNQGSMDGFFDEKPGDIDLGRQTGTAADFFEPRPDDPRVQKVMGDVLYPLKQTSDRLDSVKTLGDMITRIEKPVTKAKTQQKAKIDVAGKENFAPVDEAAKKEFFDGIKDWNFQIPGDRELLEDLFDARRGADNRVDPSIELELDYLKKTDLKELNDLNTREEALDKIKQKLLKIPEETRTEAQKKAIGTVDKAIAQVPVLKEADEFAKTAYAKGWMCGETVLRDMYLAGKDLPQDHPYNAHLNRIREGESEIHPEFKLRKNGNGVISTLQTYDEFGKAKKYLDETTKDTPAIRNAKESITRRQSEIKRRADGEREKLDGEYSKWLALGDEGRQKCKELNRKLGKDKTTRIMLSYIEISHHLTNAATDPKKEIGWHDAMLASQSVDRLADVLPPLIRDMKADHQLYNDAVEVLSLVAPAEKVKEVTDAAQAELAERKRREFEAEMSKFKTMQQNLRAVEKSYFGHTNTEFYNHMKDALNHLIENANNLDQLKEEKKTLAGFTRAYLEHTGLGKASMFHPKAETRRKIAFLMLAETSTGEESVQESFDTYKRRANALRNRSNQIDLNTLRQMPGVGALAQANEAVRETDANALANKLGQNQPARESHQRKPAVTVNAPTQDLTGPQIGQPSRK